MSSLWIAKDISTQQILEHSITLKLSNLYPTKYRESIGLNSKAHGYDRAKTLHQMALEHASFWIAKLFSNEINDWNHNATLYRTKPIGQEDIRSKGHHWSRRQLLQGWCHEEYQWSEYNPSTVKTMHLEVYKIERIPLVQEAVSRVRGSGF
jgi:hypothetical protein